MTRKNMMLLISVVLLWYGAAQAYTPPDNFRGIPWGRQLANFPAEFFLLKTNGDMTVYARYNEKYAIGEANLTRVHYLCFEGRFYGAMVYFEGRSNFPPIKEALTQTFGPGQHPNRYMHQYLWGLNTIVEILLDYSEVTTKGSVYFQFGPIVQEKRLAEQQKGKAAGKDL